MNIKTDLIIRKKFHSGFARAKPVTWFVVHGTAGGGTLNWIRKMDQSNKFRSSRYRNYKRGVGLFHYLIDVDGTVTEIISPSRWVYHASIGHLDGGTIGVELLNKTPDNSGQYSKQQYDSLIELYKHLTEYFPEMKTILSHRRCQQKAKLKFWKNCPGTGFDWSYFRKLLEKFGFDFGHDPKFESFWDVH